MAERSYPFDAGEGAAINELQWSYMARAWQVNGVDAPGPSDNSLKVEATGQPFTLLVRSGHAKLAGFHYHLDGDQTVLFEANPNATVRIDRLVLRLNRETNTVALAVKKGLQGSSTPPALDRSWESPELPLAYFTIRANNDTIAPADLMDAREFVASGVQMLPTAPASAGARQLAVGQIGYDPAADKFYAQETDRKFELSAPPDLSPYLTKTSAVSTYLSKTDAANTYMKTDHSYGTVTPASGWSNNSGPYWFRMGDVVSVNGIFSASQNSAESIAGFFPLSMMPYGGNHHSVGYDMAYQLSTWVQIGPWYENGAFTKCYIQIIGPRNPIQGGGHLISATFPIVRDD
jgi:hypothetical protein